MRARPTAAFGAEPWAARWLPDRALAAGTGCHRRAADGFGDDRDNGPGAHGFSGLAHGRRPRATVCTERANGRGGGGLARRRQADTGPDGDVMRATGRGPTAAL